jgi:hypothetical protein
MKTSAAVRARNQAAQATRIARLAANDAAQIRVPLASTSEAGILPLASGAEAVAGIVPDKAISPATLATVLEGYSPGGGGSSNSYFPSGW